jgi:hypothetical protein
MHMPLAPKAPCARLANFVSIYFAFLHLISDPRAAERVFGPAWRRAFRIYNQIIVIYEAPNDARRRSTHASGK